MISLLKEKRRVLPSLNDKLNVTFLNPYSYLIARKNLDCFKRFDAIFCDGILLSVLLRIAGEKVPRISFDMTSLAPVVFSEASGDMKNVFFIGGAPGIVEVAKEKIKDLYPNLRVCGCRHGYFNTDHDRKAFIDELVQTRPDVVVVGMGTPLQERFLIDLKDAGWTGAGYTCGGFFHQTASKGIKYYPIWFDRLNLRWLYRMIDEPKLLSRYLFFYPKFLIFFLYDLLVFYFERKTKNNE